MSLENDTYMIATRGHLAWDYLTFHSLLHSCSDSETFDHNLDPYIIFYFDNRHNFFHACGIVDPHLSLRDT